MTKDKARKFRGTAYTCREARRSPREAGMPFPVYIWMLLLASFLPGSILAAPASMPVVAVKEAKVSKNINEYALRYLNLGTLWDEMELSIQKNRKFALVSRKKEVMKDILEEQEFAKSDFAAGNAATGGQLKNLNFLILPTVQDFKFYRVSKPVPNLDNKYTRTDHGMLEINAQIIDTSTGGIKATFYLKDSFATSGQVVNSKGGAPNSVHFTNMAKEVSAQMADQLVNTVFPMRILNIQDQQVWINRGEDGGLKTGQVLKVFRPGEELVDPDTGEVLGSAETRTGQIKVTRINPKFTIAEVVNGDEPSQESIKKGDIVRE